jgi:hypothetical protein
MNADQVNLVIFGTGLLILSVGVFRRNRAYRKSQREQQQAGMANADQLSTLRKNLLLKTLGDYGTVESLIDCERKRLGNVPLAELMQAAIERWGHDNR